MKHNSYFKVLNNLKIKIGKSTILLKKYDGKILAGEEATWGNVIGINGLEKVCDLIVTEVTDTKITNENVYVEEMSIGGSMTKGYIRKMWNKC